MSLIAERSVSRQDVEIERIDPRLLTGDPWYIFNIYGLEHNQRTGSTGDYYIPPCPPDIDWVRAVQKIDGTVVDTYAHFVDKETYRSRATPGEDIVAAVLGKHNPNEDITRFGVFCSHNSKPTKEELAAANARLNAWLVGVVAEADRWSVSADDALRESVCQKHFDAARRLNLKRPWMTDIQALSNCPFCNSAIKPGVPKCSTCHEVVDVKAYNALKAQMGTA